MTELPTWERVFDDCSSIWICLRSSGRNDVDKYLSSMPKRHRAKLESFLKRRKEGRPIQVPTSIREIGKADNDSRKVLELKADKYRLYIVEHAGCWHLTHAAPKPTNHRVPEAVAKARSIDADCRSRNRGDHSHGTF